MEVPQEQYFIMINNFNTASYPKGSPDEEPGSCLGQRASVMDRSSLSGSVGRRSRNISITTSADTSLSITNWDAKSRSWDEHMQYTEIIFKLRTKQGVIFSYKRWRTTKKKKNIWQRLTWLQFACSLFSSICSFKSSMTWFLAVISRDLKHKGISKS